MQQTVTPRGLERARTLWRLWRNEREEPAPFYRLLATELAADIDAAHGPLTGSRVADLGCGPGWYAEAFRARGASVVPVDGDVAELTAVGPAPAGALIADAGRLPLPDASVDGVLCSNLLEHARDTGAVIAEMARILRPGGWGYLSWTNWYSPWGGHDMTPYQYLGPNLGPRLYERRHGPPRKNRYGEGLFAVHIGPTLRRFRDHPSLRIDRVEPRYWPWARAISRVPAVREVASWNCVVRFTKLAADTRFEDVWASLAGVEGWLSAAQAQRLWDAASRVPAAGRIVEIGSYRGRSAVVLASAAEAGVEVVAIDPHAGNDRGPQQWTGTADEGQADHEAFLANLRRAGVADRVRHVRRRSQEALDAVEGDVEIVYVDGAHGFGPAREDLERWGARVAPGGTLLIHDAFSSVGVTLAILVTLLLSRGFRYVGRSGSMVEYRRDRLSWTGVAGNAARQLAQLPWFARNLVLKALIVAKLRRGPWPY